MRCVIERITATEQANECKQPARVMVTQRTSSWHDAGHDIREAA